MTANKTTQCECQNWFFGTYGEDGSAESFEDYGTDCTQTTGRTFAQGHDAKLAGFLVRADLAGEEIAKVDGGMRVTFQNATHAAGTISEALAAKVDAMMAAAVARLAKKEAAASRKASKPAKAAKKAEAAFALRPVTGKVGRWTYQGTELDGRFTYTGKLGGTEKTAEAGTWTEVN